ncbi:MAG: hypothetical protein KKF52_00970 [Nanoarchaeota archaeon]|nr:hypothetical protein [Nanoarchaeota archaeon]MBU4241780.1 hypothetical protein [Nanoarchaeota archaeon]MBU4352313.1 hypothetical protein [Nanoarchaeota archaeon]
MSIDKKVYEKLKWAAKLINKEECKKHLTILELTAAIYEDKDFKDVDYNKVLEHLKGCKLCSGKVKREQEEDPLVKLYHELGPEKFYEVIKK